MGALAELFDEAAELVAVDARRRQRVLDRRIPVIDVFVGAADGGGGDADEDLVGAGRRNRTVANDGSFGPIEWRALDDSLHADFSLGLMDDGHLRLSGRGRVASVGGQARAPVFHTGPECITRKSSPNCAPLAAGGWSTGAERCENAVIASRADGEAIPIHKRGWAAGESRPLRNSPPVRLVAR